MNTEVAVYTVAAVALYWGAVPWGQGFYSAGWALLLPLACFQPAYAFLVVIGALALRTATRGEPSWGDRGVQFVRDFIPVGVGLALLALVRSQSLALWAQVAVAVQVELLLAAWTSPGRSKPDAVEEDEEEKEAESALEGGLLPLLIFRSLLGIMLVTTWGMWQAYLALPFAWGLHYLAQVLVQLRFERENQRLSRRLVMTESKLHETRQIEQKLRLDLSHKVDENAWLGQLSRSLHDLASPRDIASRVLDLVKLLCPTRNRAILLSPGKLANPAAYHLGGTSEELVLLAHAGVASVSQDSLRLLQLREPVVDLVLTTGMRAEQRHEPTGEHVFKGDILALAFPLQAGAVLYVAPIDFPSERTVAHLEVLASQAGLSLEVAAGSESLRLALEEREATTRTLEHWLDGMAGLLRSMRRVAAESEPARVQEALALSVQELTNAHSVQFVKEARPGLEFWLESVQKQNVPLLIEDAAAGDHRGGRVAEGRSLLFVPVSRRGVLLLADPAPRAFNRWHQDLAVLLVELAQSAWDNAESHQASVLAYKQLRDSEAQLLQSTKLAAIGELAAGVAHELNSPLAALLLALESARRGLPQRWETAVKKIDDACQIILRSQTIVDKLLYYSRDARAGRIKTDLNQVVQDTWGFLEHSLGLDGVKGRFELGPLPPVKVNQNEIQQILTNLLVNARDALKEAHNTSQPLVIRTWATAESVCVAVTDAGAGIPPDKVERIFDAFFTSKPAGQGTGLGLSISQQIAQQHGGRLEVESRPGQTTFILRLPLGTQ